MTKNKIKTIYKRYIKKTPKLKTTLKNLTQPTKPNPTKHI